MIEEDGDLDGQVVYLLGIPADASSPLVFSGRRTILVDDLYGGTGSYLALYSTAREKNLPVAGVAASDFGEVVQGVRALECIKRLQSSVLLDVLDRNLAPWEEEIRNSVGPQIRRITAAELNAAYGAADRSEARKCAKNWIENAEKVIEPSREEIERSGQMYVGMRKLLQEHGAQGIAIDCLRLFYGGKLPAYPCMGFFQLNNDGLVGACEADVQSAVTMLMLTYLVNKPGYISDPVIDTSKNQLIYAHCVAPNKVFGPSGPANKYHIRTHSEDRKGAAVRSFMPLGQMTTTMKIIPQEKTLVLHRGRTVANIDEDKACRTKLAVEVQDARKLADEWKWGWHRVTVYGDVKVAVQNLCALAGLKLVEEG
jgi:L-fucose isomerase-like protein